MQQTRVSVHDNRNFVLTIIALVFSLLACGGWITVMSFGPSYVSKMDEASQVKPLGRAQEALEKAKVVEFTQGELKREFDVYKETHP